jgi:predicted esterase
MNDNIHAAQPVKRYGTNLEAAELAVILIHGRGADADSMIPIARELEVDGVHFIIPQAASNRWYPHSAFGPIEDNEPDLSFALERIDMLINELESQGISHQQIVLGGFSQGACLTSEYAARNARRYGGLFVFSGALIGPPNTPRDYSGSLDSTPVFIGGSDVDPWIPDDALQETASVLKRMGAVVDFRVYPGMGHRVNPDEIDAVRTILETAKHAALNLST